MNAFDDLIQAAKDMDFHGANYYSNASIEARARAEKASRELFPTMAKPLVWDEEPLPFDGGHRYSYGSFCGKTMYQCGMCPDGTHYGHFRPENELFYAPTREEVKAMCEAHHQAQFLELLA